MFNKIVLSLINIIEFSRGSMTNNSYKVNLNCSDLPQEELVKISNVLISTLAGAKSVNKNKSVKISKRVTILSFKRFMEDNELLKEIFCYNENLDVLEINERYDVEVLNASKLVDEWLIKNNKLT